MFGATNLVKNSDKGKYVYNGYGIAFDEKGEWRFGNDYAGKAIIFGADNSSSSRADNLKNNFSVLGKGYTFGINEGFIAPEKTFGVNFSKDKSWLEFTL